MWQLEYTDEAKYYFLDNHPYTFDLLVEIEKLKFYDPLPGIEIEPGLFRWRVLDHLIYYRAEVETLIIAVIKPLE